MRRASSCCRTKFAARRAALKVAIDLNAVPPAGIGGIQPQDKAAERDGQICYGAIGVGGTKMKLHKAAIRRLFEIERPGARCRGDLRAREVDLNHEGTKDTKDQFRRTQDRLISTFARPVDPVPLVDSSCLRVFVFNVSIARVEA